MKAEHKQQRIKKSLVALAGTDERKGYFYCLKMLGILPPPPDSGFDEWKFFTPPVMYRHKADNTKPLVPYTPKCLHDILISSHASTCEHHSFYFGHYHRHMMVLTDLFLNFAHQVLRGGEQKLRKIYPSPRFDFLYNSENKSLWDETFREYNKLKGIPEHIANHYWNPTNYENDQDLKIIEELAPKEFSKEPIDALFLNINKCYPWQIHVPRRWYEKEQEYNFDDLMTVLNVPGLPPNPLFYDKQHKYSQNEQLYINGQLDPRTNKDIYKDDMSFLKEWNTSNTHNVLKRNFDYYDKEKKNYPINNISDKQLLSSYGAKSQNTQYISKADQKKFNLSPLYAFNYNDRVPHHQLARAFFDPASNDIKSFFENYKVGYERSHDFMHDLQRVMLSDDYFSVTTFMFWPYHSWVDAELEIYLRRANAECPKQDKSPFQKMKITLQDKITSFPSTLKPTFFPAPKDLTTFNSYATQQLKWNISGKDLEKDNVGAYPIVEYITPEIKQAGGQTFQVLSAAFCARDYIITKTKLRTSNDLDSIYQDYYLKYYTDRFYFFDNIENYDFNYNYQIGSEPKDLNNYLDQNGANIPKYLEQLKDEWKQAREQQQTAFKKGCEALKQIKCKAESQTQSASLQSDITEDQLSQAKNIFKSGLLLLATYPADATNGHNPVFLKIKNVVQSLQLRPYEKKSLKDYQENGILVHDIFIFGKGAAAFVCPKCKANKAYFVDLDHSVQERVPRIWQNIHIQSLNKVLFDSKKPGEEINCIYKTISLVQDPTFLDYRLIRGSEQLYIEIIGNVKLPGSKFVRLQAESYSVHSDKLKSVLSRKHYQFNKQIDFPKIFDVDNDNQNNFFDRYVYKTLKGWINVGQKKVEFNVSIPNFQRLLRLQLEISDENGELRVVLSDPDYEAKKIYYENNEEK